MCEEDLKEGFLKNSKTLNSGQLVCTKLLSEETAEPDNSRQETTETDMSDSSRYSHGYRLEM